MGIIGGPKARELEHKQSDLWADGFARPQKTGSEKLGIEEMFIGFACQVREPFQVWKLFDRDRIGNLKRKLKIFRHLLRQVLQIFFRREGVIGSIDAYCFEHLGIFG